MKSTIAGNYLSDKFSSFICEKNYNPALPCQIRSKAPVKDNEPADVILHELSGMTESFKRFHRQFIIDDFKESSIFVSEASSNVNENAKGMKSFEFPDGFNFNFQVCSLSENLFTSVDDNSLGISDLIHKCISNCDVDLRPQLIGNIVICGGGSLIPGLVDRLSIELSKQYSPNKLKFSMLGSSYEKKFTSWIGGSILSSLGTFQQMWITKKDFDENGASLVSTKFL